MLEGTHASVFQPRGCPTRGWGFGSLVGKTAHAVVVKQRRENGQEFNRVEDLLPDTTNAADTTR